jgi:asparagine synthase (glutamine-hydrolysing)
MCGILGAINSEIDSELIEKSLALMNLRGPDFSDYVKLNSCVLGHARLSIVDLSMGANQPMPSTCGRYLIVFNGEIYNHRDLHDKIKLDFAFKTKSDTEVVLAYYIKYKEDCLGFFRGMFAFAILDSKDGSLFIARDRLGVKPLYYAYINNKFYFASRPKPLVALIKDFYPVVDRQAVRYYLEAGYIPAPLSFFKGVKKLEPGNYLNVTSKSMTKVQYWCSGNISIDDSLKNRSENDLLDELDSLIDDSVRLRMISDVPIGAFLSGGIDSSIVASYMSKHAAHPINTFTIGFSESKFDESGYAESVASYISSNQLTEIMSIDSLLDLLPTFISQYDEPFFDYSAFPVMAVSRLARRSVKVSLSGDGGDEVFGGYHYYSIMNNLERIHRTPPALRNIFYHFCKFSNSQRVRWLGKICAMNGPAEAFAFMRGVIKDSTDLMMPALVADTESLFSFFELKKNEFATNLSYAEIGMRLDIAYTLPDDYLQKVDVGSMAFSLEVRDPLLDHKIIEWGSRLPLCWKLRGGVNKYLLRKLAYRQIPREILDRPKMGFSVPMADWLRGGLREWGALLLNERKIFDALEINQSTVKKIWDAHQNKACNAHTTLWSVLILVQFYKSNVSAE